MTPNDPPPQRPADRDPIAAPGDPLEALRSRIRATQEAVEQLADEATRRESEDAAPRASERPPRQGFATPGGQSARETREVQALAALLDLARSVFPSDLQEQLQVLLRELLLLLRGLLDWYLERIDARRREPVDVEDIPIT